MDDAIYAARQIETLYYGDYKMRIKVRLFTDSKPTLESIASSRQVKRKTLRPTIVDLKERLVDRDIHSYSWLLTQDMLADVSSPGPRKCLPQEWVQPFSTPGKWSKSSRDRNKNSQHKEQMSIPEI